MRKKAEAFRSIGEVAKLLGVAPHVLRYWETQFSQLRPMKRPDGRRYYRQEDVLLAAGIYEILRDDGLTIRGAKKRLAQDRGQEIREKGALRLGEALGAEAESPASEPAPRPVAKPAVSKPKETALPLFANLSASGDPASLINALRQLPSLPAAAHAPARQLRDAIVSLLRE